MKQSAVTFVIGYDRNTVNQFNSKSYQSSYHLNYK